MVSELLTIPWKLLQVATVLLCESVMETQQVSLDIVEETMVMVVRSVYMIKSLTH